MCYSYYTPTHMMLYIIHMLIQVYTMTTQYQQNMVMSLCECENLSQIGIHKENWRDKM